MATHEQAMTLRSAFVPHDLKAPIRGAATGPLFGLSAVAKDMYDIAGEVAGGGNPAWLAGHAPAERHADAVSRILNAGATVTGKTNCDEFFYSILGMNAHYGTPVNPRTPKRIPGGSSSGSAAAVAAGAADLALGSDTGGSVRIPAAVNGIYGIRTSHGRVSLRGAMAMSATFDTCGWFAASAGLLHKAGPVLLEGPAASAAPARLFTAPDILALTDPAVMGVFQRFLARAKSVLPSVDETTIAPNGFDPWRETFRTIQAFETWQVYGAWLESHDANLGPGIKERMAYAKTVTAEHTARARHDHEAIRTHIRKLIAPGTLLVIPTAPAFGPLLDASAAEFDSFRTRTMAFTCIAGLGGLPQVTLPAGSVDGIPVGVSFIGWPGADETLLNVAATLSRFCGE